MLRQNITEDQEKWLASQLKPSPEVIIFAYAGTSYKEWKLVAAVDRVEYNLKSPEEWEKLALNMYPSAMLIKKYEVKPGETK